MAAFLQPLRLNPPALVPAPTASAAEALTRQLRWRSSSLAAVPGASSPGVAAAAAAVGHRQACSRCRAAADGANGAAVAPSAASNVNGSTINGSTNSRITISSNSVDNINGSTSGQAVAQGWDHQKEVPSEGEVRFAETEFFASDMEGDLDCPSAGFSAVADAVEAIRRGEMVVVVDDESRENEGDLIMAGSMVTTEQMAFIVRHSSGLVCAGVAPHVADRLQLPLMVDSKDNDEAMRTAFTVSVDATAGTTTGISAAERARTVRMLADPRARPADFKRPGHIFPLKARKGGVLVRPGHTEAAVDLAVAAGLPPVGVLCEILDAEDPLGGMARLPRLKQFAKDHSLHIISVADLVRYRQKRQCVVERTAVARLPTEWGEFQIVSYRSLVDNIEHVAMVKGDISGGLDVLVRVHSECLTGDIFASQRCDCGPQLHQAMKRLEQTGRGVVVYLRGHEGRGIGLGQKLKAYNLQDMGRDTVEANLDLGLPADARDYTVGAQILRDLGVRTMRLMTNNPAKFIGMRGHGLVIIGREPILCPITMENKRYLETKRSKMGHIYGSDLSGTISGVLSKAKQLADAADVNGAARSEQYQQQLLPEHEQRNGSAAVEEK